jgi:hypothetical protein
MDTDTARAILSEAAAGDYFNGALPDTDEELIDLAKYFVNEAELYVAEENPTDAHIDAIINLSISPPVLSEAAEHTNDGAPPEEITFEKAFPVPERVAETYPRRSSGGYSESDLRIESQELGWENAEVYEGFPLPKATPELILDMPTDLTELGDKALRRLHSAFNSYLGRARWRLAITNSNLANASHLKDDTYRRKYKYYASDLMQQGERPTKDLVDSFARDDDEYKEWEDKVLSHEQEAIHWKALVEIYGGNVDRLSREWTMRTEEYERSR